MLVPIGAGAHTGAGVIVTMTHGTAGTGGGIALGTTVAGITGDGMVAGMVGHVLGIQVGAGTTTGEVDGIIVQVVGMETTAGAVQDITADLTDVVLV